MKTTLSDSIILRAFLLTLLVGLSASLALGAAASAGRLAGYYDPKFPGWAAPWGVAYRRSEYLDGKLPAAATSPNCALATARWLGTFPVGGANPSSLIFDGGNIWTTDFGATRSPSCGRAMALSWAHSPSEWPPQGIAYDGANLWVSNLIGQTVTELRASDGAVLGTFPSALARGGVAFDGANIWVGSDDDVEVSKLRPGDGKLIGTVQLSGTEHRGFAFDGQQNVDCQSIRQHHLRRARPRWCDPRDLPVGTGPWGVAFDGAHVWTANYFGNSVTVLQAANGAYITSFAVESFPTGIIYDGHSIWVACSGTNPSTKYSHGAVGNRITTDYPSASSGP